MLESIKKRIYDIVIILSIINFTVMFFYEEVYEHHLLKYWNGQVVHENSSFKLNNDLLVIIAKEKDLTVLKMKGFKVDDLTIALSKPNDKLTDYRNFLVAENIIYESKSCIGLEVSSDFYGIYTFIIQHLESKFVLLFLEQPERHVIHSICNSGFIKT